MVVQEGSYLFDVQDNAASSSGSHVKLFLIDMGFCSTLVQKAIDENGILKFHTKKQNCNVIMKGHCACFDY